MNTEFSSLEILKMAISVEKEGEEFYEMCASANAKEEVTNIFEKLAADERRHRTYFKELLTEFNKSDQSLDYLYEELTSDYLKSIVNERVFPDNKEATEEIANNLNEALDIGIKSEKNSILLYQELLKSEEDEDAVKALQKLINEEKSHLVKLKKLQSYT